MNGIQSYLLRLTAAGLICAGASALCGKGKKELVRFCCACVLALAALLPLAKGELRLPDISYQSEVQNTVDEAMTNARKEQIRLAEQALSEDAREFAQQYGIILMAEVRCSDDGIRVERVILRGSQPNGQLTGALAQRFGISADAITWEG